MEQDYCGGNIYLSSLPCDAQHIGRAIRTHWGIENQLHWVLDVTFARMLLAFVLSMEPRTWPYCDV